MWQVKLYVWSTHFKICDFFVMVNEFRNYLLYHKLMKKIYVYMKFVLNVIHNEQMAHSCCQLSIFTAFTLMTKKTQFQG